MYEGFSLAGKTAIVTGSTRGIGLAIAKGFLQAGAKVTVCSRKQEGVDAAVAELSNVGPTVLGVAAHVGKAEDIEQLINKTEEKLGPIDILVNNAGTNPFFGPIVASEDWAWDKTFETNLKGPYMLSRAVARKMVDRKGGSIVNVSSVAGLEAAPMQGIYSVTKAGLIMLTQVMARELGGAKVRVNCICPGVIRTRLSQALWDNDETSKHFLARKALGRIGEPDELIGAAIYFASDASSFTTGAVLKVDGGLVI